MAKGCRLGLSWVCGVLPLNMISTRSSKSWEEDMSMHVCTPSLEIDDEDAKKELERLKSEFEP